MKNINKVFIIVLVLLLGGLGFFSYKLLSKSEKVLVPEFTNKSQDEVITWCKSLENNPCSFDNDYSDTVEKRKIIYQSISANEELEDKISFIVSLGKKIEINVPTIDENTNKEVIEKWIIDNSIKNKIEYIEEENETIEKDYVIKIDPLIINNENQTIKVYISLGKSNDSNKSENDDDIYVKSGEYIGLTVTEFEKKAKELGLTPNHNKDRDAKSSTIATGKIVWHGSGSYVDGEIFNYGIALATDSKIVEITANTYTGKTLEEFKKAVEQLGLVAEHGTVHKDDYSNTVAKGCILWHGVGTYDTTDKEDRIIHYTVSLGKKDDPGYFSIAAGTYIGYTFDNFKKAVNDLGLNPYHRTEWDAYSDTVPKGYIVKNGYADDYLVGENISYGLSLGKAQKSVTISSNQYVGIDESIFKSTISGLGLSANHNASKDDYDSRAVGTVIWHSSGTFTEGSSVSYGLSLGPRLLHLNNYNIVVTACEKSIGSYDTTASNSIDYFNSQGFTNVRCVGAKGGIDDESLGVVLSITIDGNAYAAGDYPSNVEIVVTICNELQS